MSSKWAETGILRKKQTKENFDDLLVFGYACKLFRDDERALSIDQGKHLIPWMGDERLKIDRYDGRGALSDLSSCEASREGYDTTRWLGCSETERKIEQLCDEERYYSLHTNEDEENLYKEEELKRQKANEFQYNYDVQPKDQSQEDTVATCEEEDKVFEPPKWLDVPVGIEIPKTVKENARIEKTALFVSRQGPQMEILIKAKQSNNPQFGFLNKDDPLQKYYRHLLNAIKSGLYKPEEESLKENEGNTSNTQENSTESDHYLHPLLATNLPSTQPVNAVTPSPILQYKPTADCAYTQLVSRIKGSSMEKPEEQPPLPQQVTNLNEQEVSEQYNQYYQTQYYQYYQQIAQQYATQGNCDINIILQNIQLQEQIQQQAVQYAQAACAHFSLSLEQSSSRKVESVKQPASTGITSTVSSACATSEKKDQKISLVHYSSDSDDHEEENEPQNDAKCTFILPPKEIAIIIDKMATYVAKNGISFEQGVKEKGDPRFDFLHDSHKYHKYYQYKVDEFRPKTSNKPQLQAKDEKAILTVANKDSNKTKTDKTEEKQVKIASKPETKSKVKELKAAVSFSIKKSKDEAPKDIKSALPAEESDEDVAHLQLPLPSSSGNKNTTTNSTTPANDEQKTIIKIEQDGSHTPEHPPTNGKSINKSSMIEMVDLTDEARMDRNSHDAKRALESRSKDKISAAVRERALQIERRKRAAMFLRMQKECRPGTRGRVRKSGDTSTSSSASDLEEGEINRMSKREKHRKSSRKSSRSSKCHHRRSSEEQPGKSQSVSRSSSSSTTDKKDQNVNLVYYSSDSDDHDDRKEFQNDEKCTFMLPSKETARRIDKIASYVSKRGISYEQATKEKCDSRYDFLHETHKYHKYYQYKVDEFRSKTNNKRQVEGKNRTEKDKLKLEKKSKVKVTKTPVSFSIRKSKEEPHKDIKSALPTEESDEDVARLQLPSPKSPITPTIEQKIITKIETDDSSAQENPSTNGKSSNKSPEIEMVDLTDEAHRESRNKDKIVAAVRERELQIERRKRVAMFMRMQKECRPGTRGRVRKSGDASMPSSPSDLEEGEIQTRCKHGKRSKSSRKSSKSSKHRSRYSDSKSRHGKVKKRKYSSPSSSSSTSETD